MCGCGFGQVDWEGGAAMGVGGGRGDKGGVGVLQFYSVLDCTRGHPLRPGPQWFNYNAMVGEIMAGRAF